MRMAARVDPCYTWADSLNMLGKAEHVAGKQALTLPSGWAYAMAAAHPNPDLCHDHSPLRKPTDPGWQGVMEAQANAGPSATNSV